MRPNAREHLRLFFLALRQLQEREWVQISRDLPSWELWWEEEVGYHPTDEDYVHALAAAEIHDPEHLVRAIAEACSCERGAEATEQEAISWLVMQAEIAEVARSHVAQPTGEMARASQLAFARIDWDRAVDTAVRAARALALGHRLNENDSNYALSPVRHVVSVPDYRDLG